MSFAFTGVANQGIYRDSGNPATTSAMTLCFYMKRTANFTARPYLAQIRNADESTGHQLFTNDANLPAYSILCQPNYGGWLPSTMTQPLNVWQFIALVGSGANMLLKVWDPATSSLVSATAGQTSFAIKFLRFMAGDAGFQGLLAHVRCWNAALSDADLIAEKNSDARVRTSSSVSAHSGGGGSLANALVGEFGPAFLNWGATTYSADMPSLASATVITISGEAQMPGTATVPGTPSSTTRYNRIRSAGDLAATAWSRGTATLGSSTVAAPTGFASAQRLTMQGSSGGVSQMMTGLPAIRSLAYGVFRKVNVDYLVFRHLRSDYALGAQGFFNLATGVWAATSSVGDASVTGSVHGVVPLANGWYLVWIASTIAGDRGVEFYPAASPTVQAPAAGNQVDFAGFQYEDAGISDRATTYKPTTTADAVRNLATVAVALAANSIGVGQTTSITATLKDNAGAAWDQFGPVTFNFNAARVSVVQSVGSETDANGTRTATVTGLSSGSDNLGATAGGITSAATVALTVGTATAFVIDIRVQPGWQGAGGFRVGVYRKHPTEPFPTTRLFYAINQAFDPSLVGGQSRMRVAVPFNVTVTNNEVVDVAVENDNWQNRMIDGPGIFPATAVAA